MGPTLSIQFLGPATLGATISLIWLGSSGATVSASERFVVSRSTNFQTTQGTNSVSQAQFFYTALSTDFAGNFTMTQSTDTVYVRSTNTNNPIIGSYSGVNIIFDGVYPPGPTQSPLDNVKELLLRSSYLEQSTGTMSFNNTDFELRFWNGDIVDVGDIKKIISKKKILPQQSKIFINTPPLFREKFSLDVNKYLSTDYITSTNLSDSECRWGSVTKINKLNSATSSVTTETYFLLDGYYESDENLLNVPNILNSIYDNGENEKRYVSSDSHNRIYFKRNNLILASYFTNLSSTQVIFAFANDLSFNPLDSNSYVNSIAVYNQPGLEWVRYLFSYNGYFKMIEYNYYNECKYDSYTFVFKNKYGVGDSFSLSKKATIKDSIEKQEYVRTIVDYNGDYDNSNHTRMTFNTTGNTELILNTDFLPEYMNEVFKQALLSDECWLIKDNKIIPIIKMYDDITYKTHLNDKLVQYTITVKLSHNIIKNII
jgi:hypothetical protein